MIKSIMKRDGRVVLYDESKIASAILKALEAAREGDASVAAQVANSVEARLEDLCSDGTPQIEQIQDTVEQELMRAGCEEAAKQYILYRAERTRIREAKTSLMKSIDEITNVDARLSDMKRDNANIDGNTAMGSMLQIGTAGAKAYNAAYLLTPAQAKAYTEGDIHIHDFDFYALTTTCCQIDLLKLFHGGFSTGHGYLREPQGIASYAALAAIAIQSNQNDQHGGQSVPNFDYSMAEGIGKTFRKQYRAKLREALEDLLDTDDETALVQAAIEAGKQATGDSDVRLETHAATFDDAAAKAIAATGRLDAGKAVSGHGGLCAQPEHHALARRRPNALLVHQLRHRHIPRGAHGYPQHPSGRGRGPGPWRNAHFPHSHLQGERGRQLQPRRPEL